LLRYSDGELSARSVDEVRSHVEACWQCRVALNEMQEVVAECVGYRKNVLQRYFPPPPAPWVDIYRSFSSIDDSMEPAFFSRLARGFAWSFGALRGWAIAATLVLAICALVYRFRLTPSVRAAELLQKAVIAESSRIEKPRTIQIRTRERRITRRAGSPSQLASSAADSETLQSLQAMFVAANYDWDDPLSAKSFQAWRNQLASKRDEVTEEPGDYRIQTSTDLGDLSAATIELGTRDLQPVEGRFEFRNREWVEITEVPDATSPTAVAPVERRSAAAGAETHAGAPAGSSPSVPTPTATVGDELQALAALHRIGADLGDPVTVSLAGGNVVVTGEGVAPRREQQIRDALVSSRHVVVRFSEAAPDRSPQGRAAPSDVAIAPDVKQLQDRIANQLGGRAYFEQLSSQVLDLSEPIMSRAYALRRLAEQFPPGTELDLNAEGRQLLKGLLRDHTAALRRQTLEIDRLLKPVLTKVGGEGPAAPDAALPEAWQPATEQLFQSARRLDKLLAVVFGASPSDAAGTQLSSELLSNLANFRSRLEAYGRLAPPDPERSDK
jgi:hypothetical protein